MDDKKLDPALLDVPLGPIKAPTEFFACLDALGKYNTEQFVLRLSPRVHELVDAMPRGIHPTSVVSSETMQAFSTYIHETVHWWQHIGSTSGFILSLVYPALAHQNAERLEAVLRKVGPKKSLKRWAEDAALSGLGIGDEGLRSANIAVNNAVDVQFYKIAALIPRSLPDVLGEPYFETIGHCYWMAYGHAVALLSATVDRDWSHLPDVRPWDEDFRRVRDAGIEGWVRGAPVRVPPLGLHALFEGQARMIQMQYLTFGGVAPPTLAELRDDGYFDAEYGEAFKGFLTATNTPWPDAVDDPVVALFLLVVDLAINPTSGFPLDIESFENFIVDVDPGIRFLRLCHAVRDHPELLTRVRDYSRQEYFEVAEILTTACGYEHPAVGMQAVTAWATSSSGVATILKEMETFDYRPENLVVRVLLSHFVTFYRDKLEHPEFFCWTGAWMAGRRVRDTSMRLFLKHLSLFADRADDDGVLPRSIPGKEPAMLVKTLSIFYGNVVIYDLTRQWILNEGPFEFSYSWLTQVYSKDEMTDWAKKAFEHTYSVNPDSFEILATV